MFRLVLTDGPVRRGELVRRTGLSQPSITKITRAFLDRGYLAEVSPGHGRNGVGGATSGSAGPPSRWTCVRTGSSWWVSR
ncbi:MarR family protein [Actinoalloteichus cyanogriseus DSM 43889]|uniref:MarR family protein n=1 Tax=Actinoalloteichus caeruleus DSM 43889 TaxID=1120930 RepID=A0ABT1JFT9_ACTCY|nr:MarR family protein [Actinoalloteichus caeruleus DSM 43889]